MIWTTIAVTLMLFILGGIWFVNTKPFGKAPSGERVERFKLLPNYVDGVFQNTEVTPMMAEDVSYPAMLAEFFFGGDKRKIPKSIIPSVRTDLKAIPADFNGLVWFGHSSYLMQMNGLKILVDPVFSGSASPIPRSVGAFKGTDIYSVSDMPMIDLLIITHDHYDHLDFETVVKLMPRVKRVVTSLGCGSHLEYWGYQPEMITELNWNERLDLNNNLAITALPARHFGGRLFKSGNTFWSSFLVESDSMCVLVGGDSGYGPHFKEIGSAHSNIDLAILENGQYDKKWPYIHMMPEEVAQAAIDLGAKRLFPVHSSKFPLANHAWDDPLIRISKASQEANIPLATPKIGELMNFDQPSEAFERWWEGLD